MKPQFLANLATRKLHSIEHADGRCKLNCIKEENKKYFITLEEGLNYPDADNRVLAQCAICISKYKEARNKK